MASDVIFDKNNSGVQMGNNYGNADIHIHQGASETMLNQRCLGDLRVTNPRDDKARIESFKGGLLKDSYRWILTNPEFVKWRRACDQEKNGDKEDDRLLWIKADPGKGKTMLLCGIIDELQATTANDAVLSFFFCQNDEPELRSATCVLRGLIFSLVESRPSLLSHVRRRWDREGRDIFEDRNAWEALSRIFSDILKDESLQSVVFILDALDECTSERSRLIDLVKKSSAVPKVKWIVSSRDWPEIEEQLLMSSCSVLSLEMNQESITDAVSAFIRFKVDRLSKQKNYDLCTRDIVQSYLTSNSNETFLWVALVCEELVKTPSWRVEAQLTTFSPSLTHFYHRMMNEIDKSDDAKLCKEILVTASVSFRPLTLDELPIFVTLPSQSSGNHLILKHLVKLCGSFLSIREEVVVFIHQSAKEFLLNSSSLFLSGISGEHRRILQISLGIMKRTLRRNIYRLWHPAIGHSNPLEDIIPPLPDPLAPVRYASVYWIDHLLGCDLKFNARDILKSKEIFAVASFLSEKFLHWVEALCILRHAWRGIEMMLELDSLLRTTTMLTELSSFVTDACLFLNRRRMIIEKYPLQIYSSFLIFSPDSSLVRKYYEKEIAGWIIKPPTIQGDWSQATTTIEQAGVQAGILSLSWSHDGSHIMYIDGACILETFDCKSGHSVSKFDLEESHGKLGWHGRCLLAWSFDKSKVAFMTLDKLMIWSCLTGNLLQSIAIDDDCDESHILWSKDGERIAALRCQGSLGKSIVLFNLCDSQITHVQSIEGTDQETVGAFWSGYKNWIIQILAGGASPGVQIWGLGAERLIKYVHLHDQEVITLGTVAYFESPDTQLLATKSYDESVSIWSLNDGEILRSLHHDDRVSSIDWSPDGSQLATTSADRSLRIWDSEAGVCLYKFMGQVNWHSRVSWSADGRRLALYSLQVISSNIINIWEPDLPSENKSTPTGNPADGPVHKVLWSPDDSKLAIVHSHLVKVWNPATQVLLSTFQGHHPDTGTISWGPNGNLIALSSDIGEIEIWNTVDGQLIQKLDERPTIECIAWSHDGYHIASASTDDFTVRVWNLSNQNFVEIEHQLDRTRVSCDGQWTALPLSWSPDGGRIASVCYDHMLIFDSVTTEITQTLWHHDDSGEKSSLYIIDALAWCPSGDQLASSDSNQILIWNPTTGECLIKLHVGSTVLQFDTMTPNLLKTKTGTFDLDMIENAQDGKQQNLLPICYGLDEDCIWITWKGEPFLWLPAECRPSKQGYDVDISGGRVTIGCGSGHILIFWLSPNPRTQMAAFALGLRDSEEVLNWFKKFKMLSVAATPSISMPQISSDLAQSSI